MRFSLLIWMICITGAFSQYAGYVLKQKHDTAQSSFDSLPGNYLTQNNPKETANKYTIAAEQGDAKAQFKLGYYYYYGKNGVKKNEIEAVKWYRKAAEQGHTRALFELGNCYDKGVEFCIERNQKNGHRILPKSG